jgi:hypothetical protein
MPFRQWSSAKYQQLQWSSCYHCEQISLGNSAGLLREYARHWGIWSQIDMIEDEEIIGVLCFAVCERVVAWDSCTVAEDFLAAEKR